MLKTIWNRRVPKKRFHTEKFKNKIKSMDVDTFDKHKYCRFNLIAFPLECLFVNYILCWTFFVNDSIIVLPVLTRD